MYYSLPAIERSCMNCPLCCVLAQVVIRQLQPQLWSTLNPSEYAKVCMQFIPNVVIQ